MVSVTRVEENGGDEVSLANVWVQTWADGLVRADQIVGIEAHPTPAVAGKPSRWLVDAVLATPVGSGAPDHWGITALHRTLIQTGREPRDAPQALARLLAQLDLVSAAGVITVSAEPTRTTSTRTSARVGAGHADDRAGEPDGRAGGETDASAGPSAPIAETHTGQLRFRFGPFAHPEPGRLTDREYL
jgi:hypothetical protein